jgi:diphthine-ammonia ligase
VKSLPKNALVEKQALFHTGRCLVTDDDDDDEPTLQPRVPITDKGEAAFHLFPGKFRRLLR